ncbi:hypothetical protein Pmar_PMAR016324, partial [Perkinsus marinus ATCC 50983]
VVYPNGQVRVESPHNVVPLRHSSFTGEDHSDCLNCRFPTRIGMPIIVDDVNNGQGPMKGVIVDDIDSLIRIRWEDGTATDFIDPSNMTFRFDDANSTNTNY